MDISHRIDFLKYLKQEIVGFDVDELKSDYAFIRNQRIRYEGQLRTNISSAKRNLLEKRVNNLKVHEELLLKKIKEIEQNGQII